MPRTITPADQRAFKELLDKAHAAGQGGSNDAEIDALWDLAGFACTVLDIYHDDGADHA